ncbi:hypothetical protein FGO68_gene10230 [Halteria grandinella]|uniref:Uncharacterized protein n=1 Tax=Halteria grandinella TaxID=5974 RepID=A0A8J8NQU3_HALGN|nr:hypothetical protein FGO68_gene10230 [Halteria grandinella]
MYQWVESQQTENNQTEYFYTRKWVSHLVSSDGHREQMLHQNPDTMPYSDASFIGDKVEFGGYVLSSSQIELLENRTSVILSKEEFSRAQSATQSYLEGCQYEKLTQQNEVLIAKKAGQPGISHQIGDLRITFFKVKCGPTTILAQQVPEARQSLNEDDVEKHHDMSFGAKQGYSATFRAWNPEKERVGLKESTLPDKRDNFSLCGCCPCAKVVNMMFESGLPEVIEEVIAEPLKKEEVFEKLEQSNNTRTNLFRFLGFFLLFFGILLLFSPLIALVSWIPLVGYLLAHGFSFIAGILSLILSVVFSVLTIGLAWLFYRPLLGLLLIISAGLITGLVLMH